MIEPGLFSGDLFDINPYDGDVFHVIFGKGKGSVRVMTHDDSDRGDFLRDVLQKMRFPIPDHASVAHGERARPLGGKDLALGLEFEAEFGIALEDINLPSLFGAVKVEILSIVSEGQRDDVGHFPVIQRNSADQGFVKNGIYDISIGNFLFFSSHVFTQSFAQPVRLENGLDFMSAYEANLQTYLFR
jgi:hypothetical protein